MIDTNISFPLGIIVNECLSNSLKHAFPGRLGGEVQVKAKYHQPGRLQVIIADDDDVGLAESEDLLTQGGFGLSLLHGMVKQLEGKLQVDRQGGTRYLLEITLPGKLAPFGRGA